MAQHRQQAQGGVLRRIRLRSPARVLLVVALVSVFVGTHGQFLDPVCRAVSLSSQLLYLRIQYQRLVQNNKRLADVAAYLETEEGQELAARSELGALKKGERLVICQPSPSTVSQSLSISQRLHRSLSRGHQAWHNTVSYVGELVACLFSTSGPSLPDASEDSPTAHEARNIQP